MPSEPLRRVARLDRLELADLASLQPASERGLRLRRLLQVRGIDADHFFRVEYYPQQRCWLLTQDASLDSRSQQAHTSALTDRAFFEQTVADLRQTAVAAVAKLAGHSAHFAHFGCKYQLPQPLQELTPEMLAASLEGTRFDPPCIHFDSEGGWQVRTCDS